MQFRERIALWGVKIVIVGGAAVLAVLWFFSAWRFTVSEDFIPLHYLIYFGFDRFGPRYDIFLFAILGTVIWAVNMMVCRIVFRHLDVWKVTMYSLTLLFEVVLTLALVLTILKDLGQ